MHIILKQFGMLFSSKCEALSLRIANSQIYVQMSQIQYFSSFVVHWVRHIILTSIEVRYG